MARKPKQRITKEQLDYICEQIADGRTVDSICLEQGFPSYRTFYRFLQEDEDAYVQYRKARAIQAEMLRDQIINIIESPLPTDPKLAMAEVQRRRLEVDQKDKYVRQLAPMGIRNRAEDDGNAKVSGTITLKWDDSNG